MEQDSVAGGNHDGEPDSTTSGAMRRAARAGRGNGNRDRHNAAAPARRNRHSCGRADSTGLRSISRRAFARMPRPAACQYYQQGETEMREYQHNAKPDPRRQPASRRRRICRRRLRRRRQRPRASSQARCGGRSRCTKAARPATARRCGSAAAARARWQGVNTTSSTNRISPT